MREKVLVLYRPHIYKTYVDPRIHQRGRVCGFYIFLARPTISSHPLIFRDIFVHSFKMASISLDEFAITNNAFLPESCPIKCLPDDYYQPWETIAQDLPHLIKSRLLRSAVADLPVLSTDHLQSEAEWRRAYSLLAFLSHAYVWGGDKPEEVRSSFTYTHKSPYF